MEKYSSDRRITTLWMDLSSLRMTNPRVNCNAKKNTEKEKRVATHKIEAHNELAQELIE